MQHSTASERLSATLAVISEPDELQVVDLDPYICSVTVLRNGKYGRTGQSQQIRDYGTKTDTADTLDTFVVDDLLEGSSYLIARTKSCYQLTFPLKDGQVRVSVEASADVTQVAHKIAARLMESATPIQRLAPDRPKT